MSRFPFANRHLDKIRLQRKQSNQAKRFMNNNKKRKKKLKSANYVLQIIQTNALSQQLTAALDVLISLCRYL